MKMNTDVVGIEPMDTLLMDLEVGMFVEERKMMKGGMHLERRTTLTKKIMCFRVPSILVNGGSYPYLHQ